MGQYHLGEFEEVVLLTVAVLNGEAYGMAIIEEMEKRLQREVSIGALQTVLRRLEDKGLVTSEFGEATRIRGGKRKRYFKLTKEGMLALSEVKNQRMILWKLIPKKAYN